MTRITYWRCPECHALNDNSRTDCGSCGVEIPERWDA